MFPAEIHLLKCQKLAIQIGKVFGFIGMLDKQGRATTGF